MSLAEDYHNTQYYQAPYRPMARSSEGAIREGNTEWLKMLHRVDASPHYNLVTAQVKQSPLKPAPIPRFPPSSFLATGHEADIIQERIGLPSTNSKASEHTTKIIGRSLPPNNASRQEHNTKGPDAPYRPFDDSNRTDEYYRRYLQLSGNVSHRYPHVGHPREKQGAMGGSWRHIKEVLGNKGSQVCFVDGLVSLYDMDAKAFGRREHADMRAAMSTPAFGASRHNVPSYARDVNRAREQQSYKPWRDGAVTRVSDLARDKMASGSCKYKGFYSYRQ